MSLFGCVSILGDEKTSGCDVPDCEAPWAYAYGDQDAQVLSSIAVDAEGNIVAVGAFAGTVDFGGGARTSGGGTDAFVVKLSASGRHLWSLRFGNAGDDAANGVAIAPDGSILVTGVIAGTVDFDQISLQSAGEGDVFVAKLSSGGEVSWAKRFGDPVDQIGVAITADTQGNVIAAGCMRGNTDFGGGTQSSNGDFDAFVVKLDGLGRHLWDKVSGGLGVDCAERVAHDGENVLVAGRFWSTIDFGTSLTSGGGFDAFAVKLDASGGHLWTRKIGDPSQQFVGGIAATPGGGAVIAGSFGGTVDFGDATRSASGAIDPFVMFVGANGKTTKSVDLGDKGNELVTSAAVDAGNDALISGISYPNNMPTSSDVYLANVGPNGNVAWARTIPQTGSAAMSVQRGSAVAVNAAGSLILGGDFCGSLHVAGKILPCAGTTDVFIAKLGPASAAP